MDTTLSLENTAPTAEPLAQSAAKVRKKVRTDHHLWGTYILLVIVAVIELFSASIQEVTDGNIFRPVLRHGAFIAGGLLAMLLLQRLHYKYIYRAIPWYVAFSVIMMIAVRVVGSEVNGAMRAITVAGVPILPAEFMKLGAALGTAWILSKTQVEGRRDVTWAGLWWCMAFMGLCAGLLFSQGLSNTIVVVCICYSMMLVGGMGVKKFLIACIIGGVIGGCAYGLKTQVKQTVELTPYQERVLALNGEVAVGGASGRGNVWNDRMAYYKLPDKHLGKFDVEHQQEQLSFIAQAHGGLTGVGIGRSRENARLPLAFSDYIFAIIIEEMGLFAGLGILIVYMWILGRSAKLTMCFKHTTPGVIVMGCSFVIVFQALYHMAIVSGVFPVSGQPLPLISKGGICVIVTSLAFGVMLSVARHAARVSDSGAEQRKDLDSLPADARSVNPVMTGVVKG